MRDFPTLSYTSASKIPTFSYTRTLKRYPSLGRSLPYSSLNTLKKDCLSVRNIGKPQVAFLFTVFFYLCVYFSPRIGHYRKYPPPPPNSGSDVPCADALKNKLPTRTETTLQLHLLHYSSTFYTSRRVKKQKYKYK